MKKPSLLLYALTVLLACCGTGLAGCSNEEPRSEVASSSSEVNDLLPSTSTHRNPAEAVEIALQNLPLIENNTSSSRSLSRTVDCSRPMMVKTTPSASRSDCATDTLYYVVNFSDQQGFAIVAANRLIEPLLAITEQGSFDPSRPSDNPGFQYFINSAEEALEKTGEMLDSVSAPPSVMRLPRPGDDGTVGFAQVFYEYDTIACRIVNPRLQVYWGQNDIFGANFPNSTAGCVNIAIAQALTYFRRPASILLNYDPSNIRTINLDWDKIIQHKSLTECNCGVDFYYTHPTIAALVRQIAHLTGSTFYNNSTGASWTGLKPLFESFGITSSVLRNFSQTPSSLYHDDLMFMVGDQNGEYHAWLIDGVDYLNMVEREYYIYDSNPGERVLMNTVDHSHDYYHINWGWDGQYNGFFTNSIFSPTRGSHYDHPNLSLGVSQPIFTNLSYFYLNI